MNASKIKFLAVVASLLLFSGAAMATTITNEEGTYAFGGFDWASNGTAVIEGYVPVTGDVFDLTYFANAISITAPGGAPILGTQLGVGYEYTIVAEMNETVTITASGADFFVNSGSFNIYYDTTKNSNMVSGLGFTDGDLLISGTILSQDGGQFGVATGNASLYALVTFTNSDFINPDLATSWAVTTLQFGSGVTGWTAPNAMPGGALPEGALLLQADANQTFTAVPEPGTLVLLGLGLTGLAVVARRRK